MMTIMIRVSLHINTTFLYKISTDIDTSNGKQDGLLVLIIKPTSKPHFTVADFNLSSQ